MLNLVEGQTGRIRIKVLADGSPLDLTGCTVALLLYPRSSKTPLALAGTFAIEDAPNGIVHFDPNTADLKNADAPLSARIKVTYSDSTFDFFPNGSPDQWIVRKP